MPSNMTPSRKPGDEEDSGSALTFILRKYLQRVNDTLPARVVSYDRDTNRAQLELMYQQTFTDGSTMQMSAPVETPALQIGGGGMVLNFPLTAGDLGWIKATDRDISLFLQSYEAERGNTERMHSFEDALFIPDVMKGWYIDDPAAAVLQTLDGGTSIALKPGSILINVEGCTLSITSAGIVSNKPITAPQFTGTAGVNLIGHIHSDSSGDTIGPARNP